MAIKNKDGSLFKLKSPPPVMHEQTFWNEKVKVHNKFGRRHIQALEQEEEEQSFEMPEQQEEIKIVESIKGEKPKSLDESIIDVWCLPCVGVIQNTDELYGESYEKPEYGDKFIFKAKILQSEDLFIQIIAKEEIPLQSVLYPRTNMKRWWEVKHVAPVKDGFHVISGVISPYQPSFS